MNGIETMFLRDRFRTATAMRDLAKPLSPEWRSAQTTMNVATARLAILGRARRTSPV